jgi:DNA-binding SARP family transcriptional activator/energy-coupling factor transporter ATP-binding protein EcfA2
MASAERPDRAAVRFQLLGPLEVYVAGQHIPIASSRQRVVLGVLLMARNHVVTVEMLIDAVWDEEPPSSARGQIQICISALRRAIGVPGLIETSPDGYRIRVQQDQLDSGAFDTALASARAAMARGDLSVALEDFDKALGLWRGPALAGVPGRAVEALANRLEERRIMAVEDRIETLLGLGAHRELTEELVALTSGYPLRERLWGFQMIALYRSGRQAEALGAYQRARRALVDELGLEPGEFLSELERAILSHDSSLDLACRSETAKPSGIGKPPCQLPADIPYFVGHDDLIEELTASLMSDEGTEATPRGGHAALITGPAGCGKTTVALHVAHLVRNQFPEGQLFANLRGSSASPTSTMEVLASFLRALGVPADAASADEEERISLLRSHLADRRLLIVLDDVANEHQIDNLLPGVAGPAVLLTSRSRLAVLPGTWVAELGTMSEAEGIELLERMVGKDRLGADEVGGLARLCCGLPLALRIAGMRLAAHPHWSAATLVERLADERHRLDELSQGDTGVRPLLSLVYDSLSVLAQKLFRLLSVLEFPDFSALVAAAMLDCDLMDAARVLDELADAWLFEVTPIAGQLTRYSFPELTRIFAREQLPEQADKECRQAIERAFGCMLAFAREAHRRVYGGDFTLLHGNSPVWPGAAPYFDRLLRDPMTWFEAERSCLRAAVQQAASLGLNEFCWELAVVSTTFYENRGLLDEWRSTHATALRAAQLADNRRGEGAVLVSLGSPALGSYSEHDEKMLLDALGLFEEIGDVLGKALSLRALAHRDRIQGYPERAVERYEQALEGFRATGDRAAQTHVLSGLARAYLDMGMLDRAELLAKESLQLGQQMQSHRLQAQALHRLGEVLYAASQVLAAKALYQESLHLARKEGDRVGETYALNGLGSAELEMGDLDSAEIYFTQALDVCEIVNERNTQAYVLFGMARVYEQRGERVRAGQYYLQAANSFAAQKNTPWYSRAMDALYEIHEASENMLRPLED